MKTVNDFKEEYHVELVVYNNQFLGYFYPSILLLPFYFLFLLFDHFNIHMQFGGDGERAALMLSSFSSLCCVVLCCCVVVLLCCCVVLLLLLSCYVLFPTDAVRF